MDLRALEQQMRRLGATHLLVKPLAPNDNSKNQIYLGGNFEAINSVPYGHVTADGRRAKASLDLWWLDRDGRTAPAPGAQLILYPQYPEIRMSGFLRGCETAPTDLLSGRAEGRRLILGVVPGGRIIGFAVAADDPLAAELRDLEMSGAGELVSVFVRIDLGQETRLANEDVLLSQIGAVAARGFIPGQRLRADGTHVDTNAANAGGHTLEAALGVAANSSADADFLGWELKALTVKKLDAPAKAKMVTVITPEPKAGLYAERGVVDFIRRYGYADKRGRPDRLNVGGQYRAGVPVEATGLTLRLTGYEQRKGTSRGEITDIAAGAIELVDGKGSVAAAWPYIDLIEHWQRKHASAAYVPMLTKVEPSGRRFFRYSETAWLGRRTEFLKFIDALAWGEVVYDPGIKLEEASTPSPKPKRRSQFRIKFGDLSVLYSSFASRRAERSV